ncbi:hypothetical protein [Bradyrhizobium sp. B117]|uniref:hypothetical protein n=1 Tax=Bradyrhizobium sp. B117 TaxID=3140246 RepID=UPI0031838CAB
MADINATREQIHGLPSEIAEECARIRQLTVKAAENPQVTKAKYLPGPQDI